MLGIFSPKFLKLFAKESRVDIPSQVLSGTLSLSALNLAGMLDENGNPAQPVKQQVGGIEPDDFVSPLSIETYVECAGAAK